jgi:hypothetical protein
MQRTLKRELKVLEIVKREAIGGSTCLPLTHLPPLCRRGRTGLSGPFCGHLRAVLWRLGGGAFQRRVRQHRWAEQENDPGEVPRRGSLRPFRSGLNPG